MLAAVPAIIAAISGILNRIISDPDKRLEAETEIQRRCCRANPRSTTQ